MDAESSDTLQSTPSSASQVTSFAETNASVERRLDLTQDNTVTPIDLECVIQAERLTAVLDEAIYKTKLAVCLPKLVEEYDFLSSVVSETHMQDLVLIFEQYEQGTAEDSPLMNEAAVADIKNGNLRMKNRLSPPLGHLIYILSRYSALKPQVEQLIEEMKKEAAATPRDALPPTLNFLLLLEKFRELMVTRMASAAAEELAKIIRHRKVLASNAVLIKENEELRNALNSEAEKFEADMKEKSSLVEKLRRELEILRQDIVIQQKIKVRDSERQMVLKSRAHAVKDELLQEEDVETKEAYEKLLLKDLRDEKALRGRRFKVETQLLQWIAKYDSELSDKQVDLDELQDRLDEEMDRVEVLEKELAEQDKEFIPLMEEREKEYHEEMQAKMEQFRVEHAAKVIQQSWRTVVANRNEKKKLINLSAKVKRIRLEKERREKMQKQAKRTKRKKKQIKKKETGTKKED